LPDRVRGSAHEPHTATWDGKTESDRQVASGVYFYMMEAADYKATKKMLVVQ